MTTEFTQRSMGRSRVGFGWLIAVGLALGSAFMSTSQATVVSIEGQPQGGNLLQNADFQGDWLCLLPESHTLVWCYLPDYYNRRDYNPDAWWCKGNWRWDNADGLPGERHLMLQGLNTVISQAVNWALVFDDTKLPPNGQIADDGGFPLALPVISTQPLSLVRDLTLRVLVRGENVPAGAGSMDLRLSSTASTAGVSAPWPTGTFDWRWMSLTLPAATWKAATPAIQGGTAWMLPMFALTRFTYNNAAGSIELGRAELFDPGPPSPNLLSNGGFEAVDAAQYPLGWSAPVKFLRFPLKLFYLFQTWHNAISDNRGPVTTDAMVTHSGARSLKMIMPSGDEKRVLSDPLVLNQTTNRLIEVWVWVKTDRLAMLHIGALDQNNVEVPGYYVIQKAKVTGVPPNSSPYQFTIVADCEWTLLRQIFMPKAPLASLRLQLCARGANGYTLEDTGGQPQNNSAGTIWWDDVRVYEPESTVEELAGRGVTRGTNRYVLPGIQVAGLDLGERLLGRNRLRATVINPGAEQPFKLRWSFVSPTGVAVSEESALQTVPAGGRVPFELFYELTEPVEKAYTEYKGRLEVVNYAGWVAASNELWFTTWDTPIDIQLGALYAPPQYTNQYVRMNLGLSSLTLTNLNAIRLEIRRLATGAVTQSVEFAANPATLADQRLHIPIELYDDCRALVLKDLDISALPIQPFSDPERRWVLRALALDATGGILAQADSDPFCRMGYEPPQPALTNIVITTNNLLFADGRPYIPWGRIYQNVATYDGPAVTNNYRDLRNLPAWNLYGWRFATYNMTRQLRDFNVTRYYCREQTPKTTLNNNWANDNIQAATAFSFGYPAYSLATMFAKMGGQTAADSYLDWCRTAPMVASIGPGIEECFSEFVTKTPEQIDGLRQVTEYIRDRTDKPIMVSHGGYWNRFEFELVPFFDIFDPETEPLFPANFHTDIQPLIRGQQKTIWARPQMYENVPYERWRFHTYVELMRGCRGWQMAHGIGDMSLFRGLHAELDYLAPAAFSDDSGPAVEIDPPMEHWVRRANGKTTIIAATTRGLTLGKYRWDDSRRSPVGRSRYTTGRSEARNDDNSYCMGLEPLSTGPTVHGIHHMPDSRVWPEGSRLVQWVYLDPAAPPTNLAFLVKADGRWLYGVSWGPFNPDFNSTSSRQEWFLRSLHKNAPGFAFAGGWGALLYEGNKGFVMTQAVDRGSLPAAGSWHRIEVPLAEMGITTQLVEGVAFIHNEEGRVWWSHTTIVDPEGRTSVFFGNSVEYSPAQLAETRITVAGLTDETPIRVVFEDRTLTSYDGSFVDDFTGKDLYQRFGGDFGLGYGAAPVALHIYEIDGL
jgi:hypothetical protein